jgi:hypothetical protein
MKKIIFLVIIFLLTTKAFTNLPVSKVSSNKGFSFYKKGVQANVDVKFISIAPEIDGFIEGVWDSVVPVQIAKNFRTERATVTATWQALYDANQFYVIIYVEDNDHWPGWEAMGDSWLYDKPEVYWDVNSVLTDGGGAGTAPGHWQLADGFTDGKYDTPISKAGGATINPGGTYAYSLVGEGYVYEMAVPWANLKDNTNIPYDPASGRLIGFDVTVIDQDEGITVNRQRKVWTVDGSIDEAWNNMDDAGTLKLVGGVFIDSPVATAASNTTQNSFSANWNASFAATGYRLDIALNNSFTSYLSGFQNKDVGNVTTFPITGLTANKNYYYRVRAYNNNGTSGGSNTINAKTLQGSTLNPPRNLTAATTIGQISLSWSAPISGTPTSYTVYRSLSENGNYTALTPNTNTTFYTVTGLSNGITYWFYVKANYSTGESVESNKVNALYMTDGLADVEVNYTLTAPEIDGFIENVWDAAIPVPISKNYRTETPTVTATWQALFDADYFYVVVNVEDDNHWPGWEAAGDSWLYDKPEVYWDVNSVLTDNGGAGISPGHWQLANGFTDGKYDTPITKAAGATINPGGKYAYSLVGEGYVYEMAVPWANLKDNTNIPYDPASGRLIGFDVTVIDQDEGITTNRQRKVWTVDGTIDEAWNNMDGAGTLKLVGSVFINAPVATAASNTTQNSFLANWNASIAATGYKLDISLNNSFTSYLSGFQNKDIGNVTTFPVTGLTANTNYYYRVRVYNSSGTSGVSNTINAKTLQGSNPYPPRNLTATTASDQISLSWSAPISGTPTSYSVYRSLTENGNYTALTPNTNTTFYTVTGLSNEITYWFYVKANDTFGESIPSNKVNALFMADGQADVDVNYTSTPLEIDGIIEDVWNAASPVPIVKSFRSEMATITATWQALYDADIFYVVVNVEDNNHWPGWEAAGDSWLYDRPEIYWDVNSVLIEGGGAGNTPGHWTLADGFTDGMYDTPVTKAGSYSLYPGGTYAYSLVGEGYVYEMAVPWANLKDNTNIPYDPASGRLIGFDVTVIDQDEGITTSRQRKVWSNNGTIDESWNNMDGAGTLKLVGGDFNYPPVATVHTNITQTSFSANWNASVTATGYRLDVAFDNTFTSYLPGFQNKDVGNVTTYSVTGLTANTNYYYHLRAYNSNGTSIVSNIINAKTLSGTGNINCYILITPLQYSNDIPLTTNVTLNFCVNELLVGTDGYFIITDQSDEKVLGVTLFNYLVNQSMINGNSVSFTAVGLKENTTYSILLSSGAITDFAGNPFIGFSDPNYWTFTTGDFTDPVVSVADTTVLNDGTSAPIAITSSEAGIVYLARNDVPANATALLAAISQNKAVIATVTTGGVPVFVSAEGLIPGTYKVYGFDASGRMGVAANIITVINGIEYPYHTIKQIQGELAASPFVGQRERLMGIVSAVLNNGFYIQDANAAWSGIFVNSTETVTVGSSVDVIGTVSEVNGLTTIGNVEVIIFIAPVLALNSMTIGPDIALSEMYEGVLVKITGRAKTGGPASTDWTIASATGINYTINNSLFGSYNTLQDYTYCVTGIVTGDYKVLAINIENQSFINNKPNLTNTLKVYPNPFDKYISFSVTNDDVVTKAVIINITGQIVKEVINPKNKIAMSEFSCGVYFISFQSQTGIVKNERIIKR